MALTFNVSDVESELDSVNIVARFGTASFYKGIGQTWTVPAGVTLVKIEAYGAQGGSTFNNGGGLGAYVYGYLSVTPSTTYYIAVGGQDGTSGGGAGGPNTVPGAVGGGMTWFGTTSGTFSQANAIIVAAGGGGQGAERYSGGGGDPGPGGYGGFLNGQTQSGGGGTTTGPGAGGGAGFVGGIGIGGTGGSGSYWSGGGGGGAGYYGGGGGDLGVGGTNIPGGSGGGGASYVSGALISYGGLAGSQSGDGFLAITYILPLSVSDAESIGEKVSTNGSLKVINITEPEPIVDSPTLHILSKQPTITFRSAVTPYNLLSTPLVFSETIAKHANLPVLAGDKSGVLTFRIYNNFNLAQDISTAYNVTVTTYDGVSYTASTPLVTQQWVNLQENGFGIGSTTSINTVTFYQDAAAFVGGGSNVKTFAYGADGSAGSNIAAG